MTKATIIVDIGVLEFNAHCMLPFATNLLRLSQSRLKLLFLFFQVLTVRRVYVTGTKFGQRKHNEFREPNLRLTLV